MSNINDEKGLTEKIPTRQKIVSYVKKNMIYIIVALISLIYIAYGLVKIVETGKSIQNIILDGALALLVGWIITTAFGISGSIAGTTDPIFVATKNEYGKTIVEITPNIDKLDNFCEEETKEALKRKQTNILIRGALSYKDFVDGKYDSKEVYEKLTDIKKKRLNEARKCSVKALTSDILLSDNNENTDENDFGKTPNQHIKSRAKRSLISKIITMTVFGYYTVALREGIDYGAIIWATIQVAVFIGFGMLEYLNNYNYEIGEHRNGIIRKINKLLKFSKKIQLNPNLYKDEKVESEVKA